MRGLTSRDGSYNVRAGSNYQVVASSTVTSSLHTATGAVGDYLAGVLLIPSTTSPGAVSAFDGGATLAVFAGGTGSVSNLVPFFIPVGANSISSGWTLTTGTSVTAIATGDFS